MCLLSVMGRIIHLLMIHHLCSGSLRHLPKNSSIWLFAIVRSSSPGSVRSENARAKNIRKPCSFRMLFSPASPEPTSSMCDTPPRLKSRGFFCLSSVRDTLRTVAWPRLGAHRSGGGKAEWASPFRRILSWAVPGPLELPCLAEREEWPTTSAFGVLGSPNTRAFRLCSPGNVPQGRRLFLMRVFTLPHFLKPYNQRCRVFAAAQRRGPWWNMVVFLCLVLHHITHTRFSCSKYYSPLLFTRSKSGKILAKAEDALPLPLKRHGLRRAQAPFCHLGLSGPARCKRCIERRPCISSCSVH